MQFIHNSTYTFFYFLRRKYARSRKNIRIFNYIYTNNFGFAYMSGALSCLTRAPNFPTYRHGLGDAQRDIICYWHNSRFADAYTKLLSSQQVITVLDATKFGLPGGRHLVVTYCLSRYFFPLAKILHALNPTELSWTPVLPRHSCLDFYIPRCPWVPRAHVISRNIFSSTFKSKKAIIVTTFAVKPPPPTCETLTLCNLPHGKFWFTLTLSAPMQCPIFSFSASPEEIAAKPSPRILNLTLTQLDNYSTIIQLNWHPIVMIVFFVPSKLGFRAYQDPAFPFIASISNSRALVTRTYLQSVE